MINIEKVIGKFFYGTRAKKSTDSQEYQLKTREKNKLKHKCNKKQRSNN